jgi:exportin-1
MACETFLKICQRCKQQFVKHQPQEQSPFIDQLLIGSSTVADIGSTIADLEAHQARAAGFAAINLYSFAG